MQTKTVKTIAIGLGELLGYFHFSFQRMGNSFLQ